MTTPSDIRRALRATRAEFARAFLQAQGSIPAEGRVEFEAVGLSSDDGEAFDTALRYAQVGGWLDDLLDAIIDERLEDGTLSQAVLETASTRNGGGELQGMVNVMRGFAQPHLFYRGVADAMRWTAKVKIDGTFQGSAFLVSPHLALTPWHVIKQLFTPSDGGGYAPIPDIGKRLTFEFDDFLVLAQRGKGLRPNLTLTVRAMSENWCVTFCPCHPKELDNQLPDDLTELDAYFDYVVVRLSIAPGIERRWGALSKEAVAPKADGQVFVFAHPAGQAMRVSSDVMAGPALFGPGIAPPQSRFIHLANAVGGSSGGPCFDKTFSLFGFHQGAWNKKLESEVVKANRGIPVTSVLADIARRITALPEPQPSEVPFWNMGRRGNRAPVFGREDFQSLVWESASLGQPRILLIGGEPGRGKTFLVRMLAAMMPDLRHFKVIIGAEAVGKAGGQRILEEFAAQAGQRVPVLPSSDASDSTAAVWRKEEVVEGILRVLEQARDGRMVWISITDLNKVDVAGADARDVLLLLYERAASLDWMRILLDGFKGDLPDAARQVSRKFRAETVTRDDVGKYLKRFAADAELDIDDLAIRAISKLAHDEFIEALDDGADRAMNALAVKIVRFCAAALETANEGAGP